MANPWDTEDDEGYVEEEEDIEAVEKPVPEAELQEEAPAEEASSAVPESAQDDQQAEEGQPEEDPDAWRNLRVSDHSGEILRNLRELADKHPATKRAIGTMAAEYARREYDPVIEQHRAARETSEKENRALKITLGNMMFKAADENKDPRLYTALHNDPNLNARYQEWKSLVGQPEPRSLLDDPVVRGAAQEMDQMILDAATHDLPDEFIDWVQKKATEELRTARNPYDVVRKLERTIDAEFQKRQNGVQTNEQPARATAARSAAVVAKPVPTAVDKGTNAKVGKFAPASAPRSGGTGRALPKIKESELEGYYTENEEAFEAMLVRYGVSNTNELKKKGFVVAG